MSGSSGLITDDGDGFAEGLGFADQGLDPEPIVQSIGVSGGNAHHVVGPGPNRNRQRLQDGVTAEVSRALGAARIPCNVLAGFHHDHILVPAADADRAIAVLQSLAG